MLLPLLGALIGWLTNRLALKFLFWPARPWRIGPIALLGVVPRRRGQLAAAVGKIVAEDLLTARQIAGTLADSRVRAEMVTAAASAVAAHVEQHGALSILPLSGRRGVARVAAAAVSRELNQLLARDGTDIAQGMLQAVDLAALVEKRLLAMDWEQLEGLVLDVAGRELGHIELMGAVLGGLIGLVQALVVWLAT